MAVGVSGASGGGGGGGGAASGESGRCNRAKGRDGAGRRGRRGRRRRGSGDGHEARGLGFGPPVGGWRAEGSLGPPGLVPRRRGCTPGSTTDPFVFLPPPRRRHGRRR